MTRSHEPHRGSAATARCPALAIDAGLLCIMFVAALMVSSITLLGETIHSASLLVRGLSDFMTKRRTLAGSLAHYEFGANKPEQVWNLAIALATAIAGLWVAGRLAPGLCEAAGVSQAVHLPRTFNGSPQLLQRGIG